LHIDCHTAIDVVEAGVCIVTTTPNRKLGVIILQQSGDGSRYILRGAWTNDAGWM
jgi:hypothetical protein